MVAFTVNGSALCNVALVSGVAKCTSASLPVGVDSVVAKYSGDAANTTSTSAVLSQTVRAVADTTAPTVTITSPTNGVTVTGTTSIVATAADNVGVVSMTLSIDGAVVAIGSASSLSYNWDITKVAGGVHSITATAKDAAGNSATPFTIQVSSKTATSTALTSSVNPSTAGVSVTFTSTVTGNSPTGTVAFTVNGSALCNVALANGVAKCTSASLPVGVDSVVAKYSGDAANGTSTSAVLSQTVVAAADTTAPTVTITSPINGATVTGTTTIVAKATDNVAVALMTLSIDGTVVAMNTGGSLTYNWTTTSVATGEHWITATAKDTSGNRAVPFTIHVTK